MKGHFKVKFQQRDRARFMLPFVGILLVFIGVIFILGDTITLSHIRKYWPLLFFIPVILLAAEWIQSTKPFSWRILPIVILLFYSLFFLWLNFTSMKNIVYTWPNFLLAPGLGFLGFYIIKKPRNTYLLVPAVILILLTLIFYSIIYQAFILLGLLFITIGMLCIGIRFFRLKRIE